MFLRPAADVYSTLEPRDRLSEGKGPVLERDALQVISTRCPINAEKSILTVSVSDYAN